MLVYSVIYLLLAIYVERINPGEFGVAQSWNYLFKKYYWKPRAASAVQPLDDKKILGSKTNGHYGNNHWIELSPVIKTNLPSVTMSHLTKVNNQIFIFSVLMNCICVEIWKIPSSF
jgi:hypothetical protein